MEIGDQAWKESAKNVMEIFAQRTHGTYIEQKGNALIWQFSEADPEFGMMQSKELVEHLRLILASYQVEIIRGGGVADGYIEVRPAGASKGLFLEHCVSIMKSSGSPADFVMAVGDDISDEPMFARIAQSIRMKDLKPDTSFAVTVGKKPTAAAAFLDDPAALLELLSTLSKCSNRETKYFSAVDLTAHAMQQAQLSVQSQSQLQQGQHGQPDQQLLQGGFQQMAGYSPGLHHHVPRSSSTGNLDIKEVCYV